MVLVEISKKTYIPKDLFFFGAEYNEVGYPIAFRGFLISVGV